MSNVQRENHDVIARSVERGESDVAIPGFAAIRPGNQTHAKHAKDTKKN